MDATNIKSIAMALQTRLYGTHIHVHTRNSIHEWIGHCGLIAIRRGIAPAHHNGLNAGVPAAAWFGTVYRLEEVRQLMKKEICILATKYLPEKSAA